jgi:ribosome biogenesis GTPase / thiamine phosphate phosphatase
MTGRVHYGINNIYTVQTESGELLECRIKGKVLGGGPVYNPLCPVDRVEIDTAGAVAGQGLVTGRLPRTNDLTRWNRKRRAPQVLAANVDRCICILSPENPPFRPRFADRVIVSAMRTGIPVTVLLNKIDLGSKPAIEERLEVFAGLGCGVITTSAETGQGLDAVRGVIEGRTTVFLGQSGVGKSTLVNRLIPGANQKTRDISGKHNRGRHTTVYALLLEGEGFEIIDTPGIREIEIYGIERCELEGYFPDFSPYREECRFPSCTHLHEPDCGVIRALEEGIIHPDRYESYMRIYIDLEEREKGAYGKTYG